MHNYTIVVWKNPPLFKKIRVCKTFEDKIKNISCKNLVYKNSCPLCKFLLKIFWRKFKNNGEILLTKFLLWSKIIDLFDRHSFLMYNKLILKLWKEWVSNESNANYQERT